MPELRPILTIGYGARSMEEFVELLRQYDVRYLGDIRSHAFSRFNPDFNGDSLRAKLAQLGITYVYMGDTLGGDPMDESVKTPAGKNPDSNKHRVLYERVGDLPSYRRGILRLHKAWQQSVGLALMCSEGKPELCHRVRLIGETLAVQSIPIQHIDERGVLATQDEVMLRINNGQATLPGVGPSPKAARSSRSF